MDILSSVFNNLNPIAEWRLDELALDGFEDGLVLILHQGTCQRRELVPVQLFILIHSFYVVKHNATRSHLRELSCIGTEDSYLYWLKNKRQFKNFEAIIYREAL